MQNFDTLIREKAAQGCSMDEIAKEINKVMNAVEQEEKEKKRKASYAARKIEECGIRFTDKFDAHNYGDADFNMNDAVDFVIYALGNPEWKEESMTAFEQAVRLYLTMSLTFAEKGPEAALKNVLALCFRDLNTKEETESNKNTKDTDADIIKAFLNTLFE